MLILLKLILKVFHDKTSLFLNTTSWNQKRLIRIQTSTVATVSPVATYSEMAFSKALILTFCSLYALFGFPVRLHASALASQETNQDTTVNIYLPLVSSNSSNAQISTQNAQSDDSQRTSGYDRLRGVTEGDCAGLFEIVGTSYCTHGPDAPPAGIDMRRSVSPIVCAADADALTVVCDGDGESGNRVQVIYVRTSDQTDRFGEFQQSIQQWMVEVDEIYNASAQETGGTRHIRFVHDANCEVVVLNEVIAPKADATFAESISAIQAKGHNRKDRKYLMFVDATVFCGIGGMYSDESAESSNRNNGGPTYARVDSGCWGARVAAHELMHNFGGVQFGAPHSSGGYHCTDDWDIMCYSDAPKYPTVTINCPDSAQEARFDCNHDDYYHTSPPAGSYLATHWNPAFNQFLIWPSQPTPTPALTPTPTPPVSPNCTAYNASLLPVSIYDQQTAVAVLDVPDSFILSDLNLINLQIQHTFVADLEAYLVSPKGTKVLLFRGVGASERDFSGTWLDDEASVAILDVAAPFTGSFRPALQLSAFDGENATGKWQLLITDTAFRDAGILVGWGVELCRSFSPGATPTPSGSDSATQQVTPVPTNAGVTPTPTPILPRESSVQLDIVLDVSPKTIQNFRFELNGQMIVLDDAAQNDGDPYSNRFTAFLTAGTYEISEKVPNTWFWKDIECSKEVNVSIHEEEPTATLLLEGGDRVVCTFYNQRNVIVRSQIYEDSNQNKQFDSNESGLPAQTVLLYSADGEIVNSFTSNEFGKANFNSLKPGGYKVCQSMADGWQPTASYGRLVASNQTCYDAYLNPGQIAIARFGNVKTASDEALLPRNAEKPDDSNDGLEIQDLPDVEDDNAGYGEQIMEDRDATTPVFGTNIYLPLVTK